MRASVYAQTVFYDRIDDVYSRLEDGTWHDNHIEELIATVYDIREELEIHALQGSIADAAYHEVTETLDDLSGMLRDEAQYYTNLHPFPYSTSS